MKKTILSLVAIGSLTALVAGCGTTNSSSTSSSNTSSNTTTPINTSSNSSKGMKHNHNGGPMMQFAGVSQILKISTSQLMSDLKSGQSIEEVAQKQGIQEKTLVTDLENTYKTEMDKSVTAGKITKTQEQKMITRYDSSITKMIQTKGLPSNHGNWKPGASGNTTSGSQT